MFLFYGALYLSLLSSMQKYYEKLSNKARAKPRSPSRCSSQEEDLGQRLEAKLQAAEQKRWVFPRLSCNHVFFICSCTISVVVVANGQCVFIVSFSKTTWLKNLIFTIIYELLKATFGVIYSCDF